MRYVMIFLAVLVVLLLMRSHLCFGNQAGIGPVTGQVNGRYMRELSVLTGCMRKKKKLEELEEKERLYGVNLMKKGRASQRIRRRSRLSQKHPQPVWSCRRHRQDRQISAKHTEMSGTNLRWTEAQRSGGILSLDPGPMTETPEKWQDPYGSPLETAYSLQLDPEEQEQILRQCLDEEELKILEQHLMRMVRWMPADSGEYARILDLYSDKTTVYTGNPGGCRKILRAGRDWSYG